MQTSGLLRNSLTYYWRTNVAVIIGVAAAVSVLAGALLVGDSVRVSLHNISAQRLGKTDFVIGSRNFFDEDIAAKIRLDERFKQSFDALDPLILLDGSVHSEPSGKRASGIQVYGVDERFWQFHGLAGNVNPPHGHDALLSPALAQELSTAAGDAIVLQIQKPSAIPIESLQGRKDNPGRAIRLNVRDVLPANLMGEFSLQLSQSPVRAIFVPLDQLQKDLQLENQINTLLISSNSHNENQSDASAREIVLRALLKDTATVGSLGLRLRWLRSANPFLLESEDALLSSQVKLIQEGFSIETLGSQLNRVQNADELSIESASAVINDVSAKKIQTLAGKMNLNVASVFTYLVNSIRVGDKQISYSLATAVDLDSFPDIRREARARDARFQESKGDRILILLNEWAAHALNAKPGDKVTLEYFVWQDGGLITRSADFTLAGILPMVRAGADQTLTPEYPGITKSTSIADWDPPFPIDLKRIRPVDEQYWNKYRTAPKAFIDLNRGQQLWGSRYGKITSLRFTRIAPESAYSSSSLFLNDLHDTFDPLENGFYISPVKSQALNAANGATDFGEYFVYFSFFIVISALLLTGLFFKLGIEQRGREIGLLRSVGFSQSKIRSIFFFEGSMLAVAGSILGILAAKVYASLMLLGLRTWWVGAIGTDNVSLHLSAWSLLIGAVGGFIASVVSISWTLRKLGQLSPRSLLATVTENWPRVRSRRGSKVGFVFLFLGLILIVGSFFKVIGQVPGFFGAGASLLVAGLLYFSNRLQSSAVNSQFGNGRWSIWRLGFRNTSFRPGRSVLCIALIASSTFIIVAIEAFRHGDESSITDRKSGTGGFPLLAESVLPIVYDLNTELGRQALNLNQSDRDALKDTAFAQFRVRPGDDTSCLNLYHPINPRILAPTNGFIMGGLFSFQSSLAENSAEKYNPWLLLNRAYPDGSIPIIADANSMTYALHLKLGDTTPLSLSNGQVVKLRVVAALADSIFQSEVLMSESNFLKLFPEQAGYRFFLIDAPKERSSKVEALLEEKLSDFGFDVMSVANRLEAFHKVENTYLSTFQSLGGLGLLLGTVGLAVVLFRNVIERKGEFALLRAVGYNSRHFVKIVLAENAFLLFCGLALGTLCALVAIAPALIARGSHVAILSLGFLLLMVVAVGLTASMAATIAAIRLPLLSTLRAE